MARSPSTSRAGSTTASGSDRRAAADAERSVGLGTALIGICCSQYFVLGVRAQRTVS